MTGGRWDRGVQLATDAELQHLRGNLSFYVDDYDSPQHAIDAAIAASGGVVEFRAGVYSIPNGLTVNYGADFAYTSSRGITLRGQGMHSTILRGNGAGVNLLTISNSGSGLAGGLLVEKMLLYGEVGGGVCLQCGPGIVDSYARGVGQSTFRNLACFQHATDQPAFYVKDRCNFIDNVIKECSFEVTTASTAEAAVLWEGYGTVNANRFHSNRITCGNSTTAKAFVLRTGSLGANEENWWNYTNSLRDIVVEVAPAGLIELRSAASTTLENIQHWDTTVNCVAPSILLTNSGGSTKTRNTVIKNYWSGRSTTHRNGQYDIQLTSGSENTTIENPDENSSPYTLAIDLGSAAGTTLVGVPAGTTLANPASDLKQTHKQVHAVDGADHTGNLTAAAIAFTPAGSIASTDVQSAIQEVRDEAGGGGGGGAPTTVNYLVGTSDASLSAEIVVGTTPGGELGGTWGSPTVDPTHSGSAHPTYVNLAKWNTD